MSVAMLTIKQELELIRQKMNELVDYNDAMLKQKIINLMKQKHILISQKTNELIKQNVEPLKRKIDEVREYADKLFKLKSDELIEENNVFLKNEIEKLTKKKYEVIKKENDLGLKPEVERLDRLYRYMASIFCNAAIKGKINKVESALKDGFDVNTNVKDGSSAVHYACNAGQMDIVFLMLEYDGDLSKVNQFGKTPRDYLSKDNLEKLNLHLKQNSEVGIIKVKKNAKDDLQGSKRNKFLRAKKNHDERFVYFSELSKNINCINIDKIKKDAEDKDFEAQVSLGYYYKIGMYNLPINLHEAMKWFAKAAIQDPARMGGMNNVIRCLADSGSLPEEVCKILQPMIDGLIEKANSNDVQAQVTLGYYHMKGLCLPKNQATYWFVKVWLENLENRDGYMQGLSNLITCINEGIEFNDEARKLLSLKLTEAIAQAIPHNCEPLMKILYSIGKNDFSDPKGVFENTANPKMEDNINNEYVYKNVSSPSLKEGLELLFSHQHVCAAVAGLGAAGVIAPSYKPLDKASSN